MQKSHHMVLKGVNRVHNDKIRSKGLERTNLGTQYKNQVIWSWKDSTGYTMIKLDQMVLKGVNWVHNTNIGVTFLGKWSFISLRNLWISVFDVVLLKVELEMWFLQFLRLNLPENCSFHQNPWFSSKSAVFIKICGFHQNLQFSSKSAVFKNLQFSSKSAIFAISLWAFKRTTSNVKRKTTCLER